MTKDVRLNIETLLESLEVIISRVPKDREQFLRDDILQDATLMRLQESGEQMVHIRDNFPEYFEQHHTDAWYKLIGLRNIISHGYREVSIPKVWEIVTEDIPALVKELQAG